jgi:Leucine-rich repeat (LRR) protein
MTQDLEIDEVWGKLRVLFSSVEWSSVRQGIELAESLDSSIYLSRLTHGLSLTEDGRIAYNNEWEKCTGIKISNRENAALLLFSLCAETRFDQLETLDLSDQKFLSDITPLARAAKLQKLNLDSCPALSDVSALENLANLQRLTLSNTPGVSASPNLLKCSELKRLVLGNFYEKSLQPLNLPASLTSLTIKHAPQLTNLSGLEGCVNLERIILSGCTKLSNINSVESLHNLRVFSLSDVATSLELTPLRSLAALEELSFTDFNSVIDIRPLALHPALASLSFYKTTVQGLECLVSFSMLKNLTIFSSPDYPSEDSFHGPSFSKDLASLLGLSNDRKDFEAEDFPLALVGIVFLVVLFESKRFSSWTDVREVLDEIKSKFGLRELRKILTGTKLRLALHDNNDNSDPEKLRESLFWRSAPLRILLEQKRQQPNWLLDLVKWAQPIFEEKVIYSN